MPDTDTNTLQVTVEVDTSEIRTWAEKFVDAGKHGLAVVLYAFLDHPERFAIGEPDKNDSTAAPDSAVPLAEELRKLVVLTIESGMFGIMTDSLTRIAARVEAVVKERDDEIDRLNADLQAVGEILDCGLDEHITDVARKYRAEVEELTYQVAQHQQLMKLHGVPRDTHVLPDVETTLAQPDPAAVPIGSIYRVTAPVWNRPRILNGVKTGNDRWVVYRGGETGTRTNSEITLVARLVPDTRRVIDRPEDLDALPVGSIVRDKNGNPWKILQDGLADGPVMTMNIEGVLNRVGPVTLIYEPMIDSGDSGDGRTPDCPARG